MAQVSEFLRKKAYDSAKKVSEQHGEDAYGGTKWREEQMGKTGSNVPGTAAKTETAKPEYAKPVSFTAPSQQLYDAAEKEYNDYINSEEHKNLKLQNMAIRAAQMQPKNSASTYAASAQNPNLQVQEDTREKELRAKRDYYKNMVNAENDSHVMESDLAEIAKWTEEDRANLDKYVSFRQNGITSGGYAVPAKEAYNNLVDKYGKEKVEQLSYTWQRDKNAKDAAALAERSASAVKGNTGAAIGHSAATIPANLLGSVAGAYGVAIDLATRDNRYSTLDPNNIGTMASVYSGAVRGQVAEDIAGDGSSDVRKALSVGYQGAMSAADSIARTAVTVGSPVGLGLAASSSFSQTVSEASNQGATPAQAIVLGVGNAAIEAATEKVPLDNMLKAAKGGVKGAKAIAKEALRQAAIEATEEEISLFGNLLLEAAVLQEKSSYKQSIAEAIANGESYEQAKAQADKAVWAEALNTAAVSAVAGGISGGGSAAFGSIFGGDTQTPVQTEQTAEVETPTQTEHPAQFVPEDAPKTKEQMIAEDLANRIASKETQAQTSGQKTIADSMAEVVANKFPPNADTAAQPVEVTEQPKSAQVTQEQVNVPKTVQQGIKGTGAAEANFSGKAQYQDLLYEGNVQPDRASDVRPMEVPKTDTEGKPVSATAANVYGSQYTTDDLASATEESIAKGDLSYMKITNDESAARASKKIESAGGWQEAYIQWHDEVRDGKTSAEMAARGAMLLNHAAEVYEQTKATGDEKATKEAKQQWISILVDVREMGTNTAQGLQAMRMIRELAPPEKLDFAVASIKRMVASMKLQNDVKIDENLLNEYRMAETDEQRDEIMSRIQQNVADQIPSTFLDKWTALRYTNMLGNLKTNVRNVAGNVGSMIAYRLKDQMAALMEELVSVVNKDFQRTKSHTVSKEMLDFARNDFNKIKTAVNGGGKYNERMAAADEFRQGVMDKRTIFKSDNAVLNAVMKPMEAYRKGTNWMMNNEYFGDEAFGRAAYSRALAGFLKANGVKDTELSNVNPELMDKARAYAIQQAQEATFKDNTALANIVSKVQKSTGVVGQAIMPFTKTPANVLVRATEFSPLGILDTAVKSVKAAKGEATGADIINSLAKTMTGTAIFALGAALFDRGILSAGPDDDEKQAAFDKLNGKQPYSLQFEINGEKHSYTMDWMTPVAMPMFMGAEFWKMMQESDGEMTFADYEQLFTSIADPMIQMSMLQGLNDTLESIKWSDNNLGQFFINAAISYLTQGITNTLVGQIEKTTEKNRMTTYVDKDSQIPAKMQQALGKTSQKIPGWDFQQMEYRNAFGETEKNEGGLFYNLLSPGYLSKEDQSELTKELNRVYAATKENVFTKAVEKTVTYTDSKGVKHTDYNLSQEEYENMQKTSGQTAADILNNLVKNTDYKKLTDQQKAYTISAVYEYAQEAGKKAALPGYHSSADAWISETKSNDQKAFITQGTKKALNNAIGNAVAAVSNGWKVTEADKKDMEQSYTSYSKLSAEQKERVKEQIAGDTLKYLEVREKGATTQNYLDAVQNVKKLGEDPKAADKYDAVLQTKGASDPVKDALIKIYMDDYNPDHKSPDKTEIKYDYMRQKMGFTPEKYAKMIRVYHDVYNMPTESLNGEKKKNLYIRNWVASGATAEQADELYNLLVSTSKYNPVDVVEWYESKNKK